jgi:hypothetical protein
MDYAKIYRAFISDRKAREPALTGYTELHHIEPRSRGGSDDPSNLIRLTPEDHFFAHLLLAKWHDTMAAWAAVIVMHDRGRRCEVFQRRARLRYGWARRRYGQYCAIERVGAANPNYKADLVALKNLDGRADSRTRREWNESGIPHAALCGLLTGKSRSYKGWMLPETEPEQTGRTGAGRSKRIKTLYPWQHLDGRTALLTPYDFATAFGLRGSDVTSVVRGEHTMCSGWFIQGREAGWPTGRKHFRDDRVHHLIHADGSKASGTQRELVAKGLMSQQELSAIVVGRRVSAKGWVLKESHDAGLRARGWTRRAA